MRLNNYKKFTSESVSEGHPDKLCDRISDEVVDLFFRESIARGYNPANVRVACEVLATTNRVIIAGEIRGPDSLTHDDINRVVRQAIRDIGYEQDSFHWQNVNIDILLHAQSSQIAHGVDRDSAKGPGAGDQGIMFGYACKDTSHFMPAPIHYAHRILKNLSIARKARIGDAKILGPDAKAQLTVQYINNQPTRIDHIVVSTQHLDPKLTSHDIYDIILPHVLTALPDGWIDRDTVWHVNPAGKFVIGGPDGDCGLTGRKIVVDTYGGAAPSGGGAFSGKDPTKVDRSASYLARYIAKNIVAAGLAERCTVRLAYVIGMPEPLAFDVDLHETGTISDKTLVSFLQREVNLTPGGICDRFNLCNPIYAQTSAYGHFGRDPNEEGAFSWEKLDLVDILRSIKE